MVDKLASDVISLCDVMQRFSHVNLEKASKIVSNAEVVRERLKVSTEQ
jgi:hypothetical protein